jgi:hypothetical protein
MMEWLCSQRSVEMCAISTCISALIEHRKSRRERNHLILKYGICRSGHSSIGLAMPD